MVNIAQPPEMVMTTLLMYLKGLDVCTKRSSTGCKGRGGDRVPSHALLPSHCHTVSHAMARCRANYSGSLQDFVVGRLLLEDQSLRQLN